uniref:Uncharacterized protein n=1 Tax=Arundo donax TaxID=35708 RepID=A0A0A8ZL39_ARUDO
MLAELHIYDLSSCRTIYMLERLKIKCIFVL